MHLYCGGSLIVPYFVMKVESLSCCNKKLFQFFPRALTEANAKYAPTRQAVKETAQR